MNETISYSYLDGPLGRMIVWGDEAHLAGLHLPAKKGWRGPDPAWRQDDAPFAAVREQLAEYFAGARREFELALKPVGTPFQQRVWRELMRIPYGVTINYGELARRIGSPTASRAVGGANHANPIAIIVPCHRVIGASGKLTGYASGLANKEWLLRRECSESPREQGALFDACMAPCGT